MTSHAAEAATRNTAPPARVAKTASSSGQPFLEMLFVAVMGLTMAGLLYRLVIKIAAMRGRRIIIERAKPDWVGNRYAQGWPDERQQPEFVDERGTFIDDSGLSLVPAAGDDGDRRPLPADDAQQTNVRRESEASRIADSVNARETTLEQLIRDLDQLLQARKET